MINSQKHISKKFTYLLFSFSFSFWSETFPVLYIKNIGLSLAASWDLNLKNGIPLKSWRVPILLVIAWILKWFKLPQNYIFHLSQIQFIFIFLVPDAGVPIYQSI